MSVTMQTVREALKQTGVTGQCVCVHSSFRSFGRVEGGPDAVIDGILAEGNTLMTPAFTSSFIVPPPKTGRPEQNGVDYERYSVEPHQNVFHPDSDAIDTHTMGAIPTAVVRRPGRMRGNHPTHSFAALGPQAASLVAPQSPTNLFGPLQALVDADGVVILMGVGFDRMTLLHLAEHKAGRRPFIRWVNDGKGGIAECHVGGCSVGFNKFDPVLLPRTVDIQVGESVWLVCNAKAVLEAAVEAIRRDPEITRCSPDCIRCEHAIKGGPIRVRV